MNKSQFDICIIGQGIAGTLLGHFLESYGYRILIIDNFHEGASSMVAAGIVNPITGKKFVKSWRIDDFLPAALSIYDEIGVKIGVRPYTKANVLRTLNTVEEENSWIARTNDELYTAYIKDIPDISEVNDIVEKAFAYGEITQSFHVHFSDILNGYRTYWTAKDAFLDEKISYDDLMISEDGFGYNGYSFEKIVFCEGYQAKDNPFFDDLDLQPAKGEALLVRIPGANFQKMYKDKIFLVHQYEDVYWAGSGYEWEFTSDAPTIQGREEIEKSLQAMLKVPYEVIAHKAGVRPSTGIRRPLLRQHSEYKGMYLFNGLGTKGASLAPFFARQFARYIAVGNAEDLKC
jgi:glycine oxidase